LGCQSAREKDLEILLRRQQVIAECGRDKAQNISRTDKLTLAVLTAHLKAVTGRMVKKPHPDGSSS
jgi:hypothetical protein